MDEIPTGDKQHMCRACRSTYTGLYSLSECKNGKQTIMEMLATTTPELNVQLDDKLPMHICDVCYKLLNIAYNFHEMCIESDKHLREALRNRSNPDIIIKQEIESEVPFCVITGQNLPLTDAEHDPLVVINEHIKLEETEETNMNKNDEILLESRSSKSKAPNNDTEGEKSVEFSSIITRDETPAVYKRDKNCENKQAICQICSKPFKYYKNLYRHLRNFHIAKKIDDMSTVECVDNTKEHKGSPVSNSLEDGSEECSGYTNQDKLPTSNVADFENNEILKAHKRYESSKNKEAVCQICSRSFKYYKNLYRHLRTYHIAEKMDECVESPKVRDEVLAAEIEDNAQENSNNDKLETVPQSKNIADFQNDDILKAHKRKKNPKIMQAVCEICSKVFKYRKNLYRHLRDHLKVKIPQNRAEKTFTCEYCEKTFINNSELKRHRSKHTGEIFCLCPYCGKSYSSEYVLQQHIMRHTGQKHFQCPDCPSKFVSQGELSKHMTTHSKIYAHVCDTCGSKFSRSYTLKMHKERHTGRRPHRCKQCDMTFIFNKDLVRHMLTHTGERPHKCKYCHRTYTIRTDLNQHLRTHIGENIYKCNECPQAFKYKRELRDHQSQHFKEKQQQQQQKVDQRNITENIQQRVRFSCI